MQSFLKRTWAEIDLDALKHNYHVIADHVTPGCRIMAVVKADGYGHGAVAAAKLLRSEGASWFAVSNLEEAAQLRLAGITEPILILSYTPPAEAARLAALSVTQAVIGREYGELLNAEAEKAGVNLSVHIKVDTGMARVGFFCRKGSEAHAAEDIAAVCALPHLTAEGIFTHFASADEPDGEAYTEEQYALFCTVIRLLEQRGITFALRHCCNSAALMRFPHMHLDMVRPGIILYGLSPDVSMNGLWPLRPVMAVKSVLSMIKTVPAGTAVSYGRTFTAQDSCTVATVPIGYADGLPRCFSGHWQMEIGSAPAPIIGRICMDQCMLDISRLPKAQVGDEVTVLGGTGACSADRFAAASQTISYEIVCDIGKRVPRLFLQNGRIVDQLNYLIPDKETTR